MSRAAHVWTPELDARLTELRAEGLTAREIAAVVGLSADAVRVRFSRRGAVRDKAPASEVKRAAVSRPCLRCRAPMRSTGPHHRLCDPCRSGNGLPSDWQAMT